MIGIIDPQLQRILVYDLQDKESCYNVTRGVRKVYNLAADNMGGIGIR